MNLKYMLHRLITIQFRVRDQRSRSEDKVKGQGQRSHIKKFGEWVGGVYAFVVFVKSMKFKGELLLEGDVGFFWD